MRLFSIAMLFIFLGLLDCQADDWPQFRGPSANGITNEAGLPLTWGADSNVAWKVSIPGEGWSSPVAANGKVIVTTAVSEGEENQDSVHRWEIHCIDGETGERLWKEVATRGKPRIKTHRMNTYASETPVTDGQRIVVYFGMTGLFCYDFSGNLLWSRDLGVYEMQGEWGTSSSPTMYDGLVYIQVDSQDDSFLVALDADTGEERWRKSREENSNWGSPIIWKNSQRAELVTVGSTVRSYNPSSGELLWSLPTGVESMTSSPAPAGDVLLVGSSGRRGGGGLWAVRAGASGELTEGKGIMWVNDQAGADKSSPLTYQGYVYILSQRGGIVTCLNESTGEVVYKERLQNAGEFWASPWAYRDRVFLPNANGITYVLKSGPELEVLATNQLEGQFWASAAFANGKIFIRSSDALFSITTTN